MARSVPFYEDGGSLFGKWGGTTEDGMMGVNNLEETWEMYDGGSRSYPNYTNIFFVVASG